MTRKITIALDGMGGDKGAELVLAGLELARIRHPGVRFMVFGDKAVLEPLLVRHPQVRDVSTLVHTDVVIAMDSKPSQALRQGRKTSSMWQAIDAVRQGQAQAAVSAGNTGALMAMAKVILKTLPHVERPALAALWPTMRGESVVLDLGANIGPSDRQLVQFAIMGEAYARVLFGIDKPTVGLLNIGEEEIKGTEMVKNAAQILRSLDLPIEFFGFVEGDDIGKGTVDVVVTDGYTGNIALKTAEGTARQIAAYLKTGIESSFLAKIGYVLAYPVFRALREKLDPSASNGGLFLGLNGLVVKSHGGTDARGYAAAIDMAINVAEADLVRKITQDMGALDPPGEAGVQPRKTASEKEVIVS